MLGLDDEAPDAGRTSVDGRDDVEGRVAAEERDEERCTCVLDCEEEPEFLVWAEISALKAANVNTASIAAAVVLNVPIIISFKVNR